MFDASMIQSLLKGTLPAGARLFLVAAIPIDAPLPADAAGKTSVVEEGIPGDHRANARLVRLIEALQKVEPNDTRKVILASLLATTESEWLPFPTMISAIEKVGVSREEAPGRAQAALRDLSWQCKNYLPPEDLAGCTVAIDVLATRKRFGNETRYRLTELGRAALTTLAKHRT